MISQMMNDECGEKNMEPVSAEAVIWGYRLFLGRDPENPEVVAEKVNGCAGLPHLREIFLRSAEFLQQIEGLSLPVAAENNTPMGAIEDEGAENELARVFQKVQDTWQYFGETEPHWSVLTFNRFKKSSIAAHIDMFYNSGAADIEKLFQTLARNQVDASSLRSCIDYGCGLGRLTRWLATRFETVHAYDISRAHLNGFREYMTAHAIQNIELHHLQKIEDLQSLARVDLIYSIIVLQHNPPPVIRRIIRQFLRALNPGGVAYFQVPTYWPGYGFSIKEYVAQARNPDDIEMHVLPQYRIFDIIREEGGHLIEVTADHYTGGRHGEVSNSFLVQKKDF